MNELDTRSRLRELANEYLGIFYTSSAVST